MGGHSENDLEESYNAGWYDAIDCVKRKGGGAESAAEGCE